MIPGDPVLLVCVTGSHLEGVPYPICIHCSKKPLFSNRGFHFLFFFRPVALSLLRWQSVLVFHRAMRLLSTYRHH